MAGIRLVLDNGVSYDISAMFRPRRVGHKNAWQAFWQNVRGLKTGLAIPFQSQRISFRGTLAWVIVFIASSISLLLLPFMAPFGYSMRAYSFHTPEDANRLQVYKQELLKVYASLKHIEDPAEHRKQLGDAIQRLKTELGIDAPKP